MSEVVKEKKAISPGWWW